MRLTVIGSADAFNSAGCCHSCYWLDDPGGVSVMIDFGATALMALRRAGKSPTDLAHLAITHLHGDHIGGIPFLLINGMYNERRTHPLEVVGPVNLASRVEAFFRNAYPSVSQQPRPFVTELNEVPPGSTTTIGGLKLETFAASHQDLPERPLCLRITGSDGKIVAFSGDTEFCPGLDQAADGADLLVAECTMLAPPAGRHMTWAGWREKLRTIGAKRVLLSHLNREVREAIPRLLAEAPTDGAPCAFAHDGLVVEV